MNADPYAAFRDELVAAGLLLPTGVPGLYGRSATYQHIVDGLCRAISRLGAVEHCYEQVTFPPLLNRRVFDRTNYLKSFPDLMGSVHVFRGDERQHAELLSRVEAGENWSELLEPAEVVVCSATCHPVYPLCSGVLPEEGRRFEIHGYCFRHEPSVDPARM